MKGSIIGRHAAFVLLLSGCAALCPAATPVWTCATEGEVLWQHTAAVGYLVAGTKTALAGIDADRGVVVWQNKEFAGLNEDGLTEIAGTPYFMAVQKGETAIIDGFSGVRVFSAKAEGFTAITNRYPLYQCGGLLVTGKKGNAEAAVMTDMKTGAKRWEFAGTDRVFAAFEIDAGSVLIVTAFNQYRLDASSGKEIWKAASSNEAKSLDNMGALGGLIKGLAKKMMDKSPVTAMEAVISKAQDAFFIAVEQRVVEEISGGGKNRKTYSVESMYNGYKLSDGSILWKKPYEHAGRRAKMMLADGGLILINVGIPTVLMNPGMSMDNEKDSVFYDYPGEKINMLGYQDGTPLWGKKGDGLSLRKPAQQIVTTDLGIVCVTENAVNILDPRKGVLLFEKDVKIFSDIRDMRVLPCGLFACSEDKANILDLGSKELLWDKPLKTAPGLYDVRDNALYIYSFKDKKIMKADLAAKAALAALGAEEVAFEGKEKPKRLEIRPNGVLLSSDQNMQLIGENGTTVYKAYFPAPRESALARALYYAEAARMAYYGARYGMAAVQLQEDAAKTDNAAGKAILGGFGMLCDTVSDVLMGAAGGYFKTANARYKATQQSQDFLFILSKADKSLSLLKVSKNDGKAVETIDLGSDKKPVYSVDGVMNKVYYRPGPMTIVCYAL